MNGDPELTPAAARVSSDFVVRGVPGRLENAAARRSFPARIDVVMATPALRALRSHFGPRAHFVGVMRPYVGEVLAGSRWFDEAVTYTKRPGPGECNSREAVRRLRFHRSVRPMAFRHPSRSLRQSMFRPTSLLKRNPLILQN